MRIIVFAFRSAHPTRRSRPANPQVIPNPLEDCVKKHFPVTLFLLAAFTAQAARAQTTVVNFDNPVCTGSSVGLDGVIDFSLSPWVCEKPNLAGQTGASIS